MRINMAVNEHIDKEKASGKKLLNLLYLFAKKVEELAEDKCPVGLTSGLKQSIHTFPLFPGAKKYVVADGKTYGIDVEMGTEPHEIKPKEKQALAFEWTEHGGKMLSKKQRRAAKIPKRKAGKMVFKRVMHPGTTAQPFFRPAYEEGKVVHLPRLAKEINP